MQVSSAEFTTPSSCAELNADAPLGAEIGLPSETSDCRVPQRRAAAVEMLPTSDVITNNVKEEERGRKLQWRTAQKEEPGQPQTST